MNDQRLSDLLRSTRIDPARDPQFEAAVWDRIRRGPGQLSAAAGTTAAFRWALPLAASLALIASVATGIGAGLRVTRAQTNERMAEAYARTIDPILKAGQPHVHQP